VYFEDLQHYSYYMPKALQSVLTVGWLDASKPYTAGKVIDEFRAKLARVMSLTGNTCVHVNRVRGVHPCNLCEARSFGEVDPKGVMHVGSSEVWIPKQGGGFFAAPSMLIHYVEEHQYVPPRDFVDALMSFGEDQPFSAQTEYERLAAESMK
jgi:hypothetical protein